MDLDQEPSRRLEYRSPDLNPRPISGWQVVGGLIMAPVAVIALLSVGSFVAAGLGDGSADAVGIGAFLGAVVGLGLIAWWATASGRYEAWRGLTMGLWIGGGLLILLCGVCFAVAWR